MKGFLKYVFIIFIVAIMFMIGFSDFKRVWASDEDDSNSERKGTIVFLVQYVSRCYRYEKEFTFDESGTVTVSVNEIAEEAFYNDSSGNTIKLGIKSIKSAGLSAKNNTKNKNATWSCTYDSQNNTYCLTYTKTSKTSEYTVYCDIIPESVKVSFELKGYPQNSTDVYTAELEAGRAGQIEVTVSDIFSALKTGEGSAAKTLPNSVYISKIGNQKIVSTKESFIVISSDEVSSYGPYSVEVSKLVWNATYDGQDDAIVISTPVKGASLYVANVKKETGAKLAANDFFSVSTGWIMSNGYYACSIELSPSDPEEKKYAPIKVSDGKGVYLYIAAEKPEGKTKELYTPNFIVQPTEVKKIQIGLNYAGASAECGNLCAISYVEIKKTDGTTELYSEAKNKDEFRSAMSRITWGYQYIEKDEGEKYIEQGWAGQIYYPGSYAFSFSGVPRGLSAQIDSKAKKMIPETVEKIVLSYLSTDLDISDKYQDIDADAWVYTYDESWGNSRIYRYYVYKGDTIKTGTFISSNFSEDYYKNYRLVDTSERDEKVLYENTMFEYKIFGSDSEHNTGFYTSKDINGSQKLVGLSEYGINIKGEFESGDKIWVKVDTNHFGRALGLNNIKARNISLNDETSFSITKSVSYEYNVSSLSEEIENAYDRAIDRENNTKFYLRFRAAGTYDESSNTYHRCGQEIKIQVSKPSKQIKAKFDYNKEMIVVKNGYDYMDESAWITILPYKADGTAQNTTIFTKDYAPPKKAADNTDMFTNQKFIGIAVDDILGTNGGSVTIRKSATYSKPASMIWGEENETCTLYFTPRTAAPVLRKKDDSLSYYCAMDDKQSFVLPTAKKAETDTTSAKDFEYMIIDKADYEAELAKPGILDKTSFKWTKYTAGKKITIDKTKSKYKLSSDDGKATDHMLNIGSYILIRRKGAKNKSNPYSPILASNYTVLKVVTMTADNESKTVLTDAQ